MLAAAIRTDSAAALKPFAWKQVEPFLESVSRRLASQVAEFEPEIAAYAEYALKAQGKQLRPALVALSAEACGGLNDRHVTVAAIIEMVHLATLVHDDVIDEAHLRRGRPTLAAQWGNEISVLLGDCLFAQALSLAASFPTPEICRAVASAANRVCAGEILQTQQRRNLEISREDYFRALEMKTGELFALSCDLGARLATASELHREALCQFGLTLGTAYQIYDDCVDLFGSEPLAGKSLGTDLAKGKLTLPVIVALERMSPADRVRLESQLATWHPDHLPAFLALLEKHDSWKISREVIDDSLGKAEEALLVLPANEGRDGLLALCATLSHQADALGLPA